MIFFLVFFALDFLSKLIAIKMGFNGNVLHLAYNPSHILGIQSPEWFYKFLSILILIPAFLLLRKMKVPSYIVGILFAGCVGNFIWRFHPQGVVDFIKINHYVFNLADCFMWFSVGYIFVFLFKPHMNRS